MGSGQYGGEGKGVRRSYLVHACINGVTGMDWGGGVISMGEGQRSK